MSSIFIKYEKFKDTNDILASINHRIEIKKESLFLIGKVLEVAEKWNGKKITKRFGADIQKAVESEGYTVYYRPQYGMFHIDVRYKAANTSDSNFSALIAYDSDPVVRLEKVREHNRCYTLDEGRIERLEASKGNITLLVSRWNKAITELKEVNTLAEQYELEYTFEIGRE